MEAGFQPTRRDPDADTGGRWFESEIFINNPKGVGKRMVMEGKRSKPVQSLGGTVWQAASRSGQTEWSGRRVQSPENRQGSKPGGLVKENRKGKRTGKTLWLTWNIQDELAQRDRKHRDIYTRDNKRLLEGDGDNHKDR